MRAKGETGDTERGFLAGHEANFESILSAANHNQLCMLECTLTATGEKVAVVCAFYQDDGGAMNFVPFAQMFNGNPYEILNPPMTGEEGGSDATN